VKHYLSDGGLLSSIEMYDNLFYDTIYAKEIKLFSKKQFKKIRDIYQVWSLFLRLLSPQNRFFTFCMLLKQGKDHNYRASSSSGKHHPPDDLKFGGQMVHEIKVVSQAIEIAFLQGLDLFSEDMQCIIMSTILHDMVKYGLSYNLNKEDVPEYMVHRIGEDSTMTHTTKTHDIDMSMIVKCYGQHLYNCSDDLPDELEKVSDAIAWHSGPWRSDLPLEQKLLGRRKYPEHCYKCSKKLKQGLLNVEYIECECCHSWNSIFLRPSFESIYESQCEMIAPLGDVVFITHMADFIASRYDDEYEVGINSEQIGYFKKVFPFLRKRSNYIRSQEEAIEKVIERYKDYI
jgi:hypothetical protein